jgi:hypothetical protein
MSGMMLEANRLASLCCVWLTEPATLITSSDTAGDPVIAVRVAAATVAGEILARTGFEIGIDKALMVAEHGAHLAGPRVGNAQIATGDAFEHLAVSKSPETTRLINL